MSDTSNQDQIESHQDEGVELSARDVEIMSLGKDFSNYTHDANFAVYIKMVHNREEAESDIRDSAFFPDFVHQFFINSERIFGYKRPVIRLFYTAGRLKRYVNFAYEDRLTKEKDGIDADDVMNDLRPILEGLEYTQDLNQFIADASSKEELEFRPPGDLLCEFETNYKKPENLSRAQRELLEEAGELFNVRPINGILVSNGDISPKASSNGNGNHSKQATGTSASSSNTLAGDTSPSCKKRFQIFHASHQTKGFNQFQARMQTLVLWFIESANMIDFEDCRWDCFMVFEKYNPSGDGATAVSTEDRYYFAGYATVYRYFAYPDKTRPRVSQMLILPPYKRNGLGTTLLQTIYDYYKTQQATLDITAEDPDEDFISMRDLLDCRNCLKELDSFHPDRLRCGWSDAMGKEAQEKLKLCRRQARKIYEILKLRIIDKSDEEEYRNYRLEIKNRLNIPNQKQKIDIDRALKRDPNVFVPEELKPQDKVTAAKLEDNYRELEKQYEHIIDKLNHPKIKGPCDLS